MQEVSPWHPLLLTGAYQPILFATRHPIPGGAVAASVSRGAAAAAAGVAAAAHGAAANAAALARGAEAAVAVQQSALPALPGVRLAAPVAMLLDGSHHDAPAVPGGAEAPSREAVAARLAAATAAVPAAI